MRSLTLAAALRSRGASSMLLCEDLPRRLVDRSSAIGVPLVRRASKLDDPDLAAEVETLVPDLIVLDGYHFSSAAVSGVESLGIPVLAIDDNRELPISRPHGVLNQNLHADPRLYADLGPSVDLFLGPRWALVREEIVEERRAGAHQCRSRKVLVALGGSDILAIGPSIASAVIERGMEVIVACGLFDRDEERGSSTSFASELAGCQIAVIGAGSTMWEAAHLGTPVVGVIVAENQVQLAQASSQAGVAEILDARTNPNRTARDVATAVAALAADDARRRQMARSGRELVDGRGAERMSAALMAWVSSRG